MGVRPHSSRHFCSSGSGACREQLEGLFGWVVFFYAQAVRVHVARAAGWDITCLVVLGLCSSERILM